MLSVRQFPSFPEVSLGLLWGLIRSMLLKTFELGVEPHAFNSTTQEGEVEDLCELEFSLVYIE